MNEERVATLRLLRNSLQFTWYAFFGKFGGNLRPIQEAAIPPILEGRDCLVAAPTAGGKTEAALAPLIERHLPDCDQYPAIVVVSPTRALVNDLTERLSIPVAQLGWEVMRRTGDHPEPVHRKPPAVLVTTPESLDSLLCRHPRVMGRTRALVLDEIHLMEDSARGDQLAVLSERLRRTVQSVTAAALQTVALSATLQDTSGTMNRFLRDAKPVAVPGGRELSVDLVQARTPREAARVIQRAARDRDARKVLVFVRRRKDAEGLANELVDARPFRGAVYAHHGSLTRSLRESIEDKFQSRKTALCVATSTLEVGIDIGDIDLVIIADPPLDVGTLLQRVGRGNRRSGRSQMVGLFRNSGERAWLEFLVNAGRKGEMHGGTPLFRPSVLVQQALSLLHQNPQRWISAKGLHDRLPAPLRPRYTPTMLEELLGSMADEDLLCPGRNGRYGPLPQVEARFERGFLHTNISSEPPGIEVVDSLTREVLTTVTAPGEDPAARRLTVGGRGVEIVRDEGDRIHVRGGGRGGKPEYRGRGRPRLRLETARAFARSLDLDPDRPLWVEDDEGASYLYHFRGSLQGMALSKGLKASRGVEVPGGGLCTRFAGGRIPDEMLRLGAYELRNPIEDSLTSFTVLLGLGPWASPVPEEWLVEMALKAVDPDGLAAWLARIETTPLQNSSTRQVLLGLRRL